MMIRLGKLLALGMTIGILGLIAGLLPIGLKLEEKIGLDLLFRLRGPIKAPEDVIVVTLDRASADLFGLPYEPDKWPRILHARLVDNLSRQGASVIAFDIFFEEARDSAHDSAFATSIGNARNVVLCNFLMKDTVPLNQTGGDLAGRLVMERLIAPIPVLAQAALALAPFPLPQIPAEVSQYWAFKTSAGGIASLPAVVFQIHTLEIYDDLIRMLKTFGSSPVDTLPPDKNTLLGSKSVEKKVRVIRDFFVQHPQIVSTMHRMLQNDSWPSALGSHQRRIMESALRLYGGAESRYLNFYGPAGTIHTIPYHQALRNPSGATTAEGSLDFSGKVVFVGLAQELRPEQKDGFYSVFSTPQKPNISGVELAATAFANLLEDGHIKPLNAIAHCGILVGGGVIAAFICLLASPWFSAACLAGIALGYSGLAYYQFSRFAIWFPLVVPLFLQLPATFLGGVLWKYFRVNQERQNIKTAFGFYLPNPVVEELARSLAGIKASAQSVYGTCLFSDAEHYTPLSESVDPESLSRFMNSYYAAVFDPVKRHGGIVSDVVGDAMLALWTTPFPDSAHRAKACQAALDILNAVNRFNQESDKLRLPIRIALHTGQIVLGHIGAIDHYEYRAVGDVVNTTSRLEGVNKYLGTRILASEEVLWQIDDFLARDLGTFLMAGKSRSMNVFELICRKHESTPAQRRLCELFSDSLTAYRKQSWQEAVKGFEQILEMFHQDGPSKFYLNLCAGYMKQAPGKLWDATVCLHKK